MGDQAAMYTEPRSGCPINAALNVGNRRHASELLANSEEEHRLQHPLPAA